MPKFRKKPVVIEAWHFQPKINGRNIWQHEAPPDWLDKDLRAVFTMDVDAAPIVRIKTLEGVMTAERGDWIIKGVEGEIYPCKPSVFEATYEPVEPADSKTAGN